MPPELVPFLLLFLLVSPLFPVIIGRAANLAGGYRQVLMVTLLVTLLSVTLQIIFFLFAFRGDVGISFVGAATFGTIITVIVPLAIAGRLLARLIARRYAPTIADALASVIVGATASFVPQILSIYLSFTFLATFAKNSFTEQIQAEPLPPNIVIIMMGLLIFVTTGSAWILMGWGSMPTLRRRKGTVLGLVCVSLAIIYSIIQTLIVAQIGGILLPTESSVADVYQFSGVLLALGAVSIIIGMLTAGFMHGILLELASLFDFATFVVIIVILVVLVLTPIVSTVSPVPVVSHGSASLPTEKIDGGMYFRPLVLIVALSIVQIRAVFIGHRVASMLGLLVLAIPFVSLGLAQQLPLNSLRAAILALLFLMLTLWLGSWGTALRHQRYGGHISMGLLGAALLAVPIVFLIA